ncbi:MAG: hypothetical protein AB1551_02655 [Actinomycetota bacterium]
MPDIEVQRTDVERFLSRFHVTVTEGDTSTHHEVTLSAADFERLGGRYRTPEDFVRACFSFLLEREPKEAILSSFEVGVISEYFPDFERRIIQP